MAENAPFLITIAFASVAPIRAWPTMPGVQCAAPRASVALAPKPLIARFLALKLTLTTTFPSAFLPW